MATDEPVDLGTSFGAVAATYERGRPPYPLTAVDWLLQGSARRVVDLGAGTGKLTRLLRYRGIDVIAVEPAEGMRRQLAASVPGVPILAGTAESIPLAPGSVDAVLVAQAWHWVDPARAVPEVIRVLRPGGWIGLVWNVRDARVPWVAALDRILHRPGDRHAALGVPRLGPGFGPVERYEVEWVHQLPIGALIDLAASRSHVIALPPDERAALLDEVRELLTGKKDPTEDGEIPLPYVTWCYRARVRDSGDRRSS
ncbi:MAG: methyltransferase domain-containing protein [Actinomycetales bacterium]|nr:methyltransferase domain-containing protein [Actinomycetales bacterium]